MNVPVRTTKRRLSNRRFFDSGLQSQTIRFAVAGACVGLIYIAVTTTLADGFGTPFQVALAVGFGVALAVQFTLQRLFVWTHPGEFALRIHQQAFRYLLNAGIQYAAVAMVTANLPGALGVPVTPVFLGAAAASAVINFLVFRVRIFHSL